MPRSIRGLFRWSFRREPPAPSKSRPRERRYAVIKGWSPPFTPPETPRPLPIYSNSTLVLITSLFPLSIERILKSVAINPRECTTLDLYLSLFLSRRDLFFAVTPRLHFRQFNWAQPSRSLLLLYIVVTTYFCGHRYTVDKRNRIFIFHRTRAVKRDAIKSPLKDFRNAKIGLVPLSLFFCTRSFCEK